MIVMQSHHRGPSISTNKRKADLSSLASSSEVSERRRSPKRQKVQGSAPPPSFWDNLSEVPLCRRALQELDRRNHQREQQLLVPGTAQRRSRRLQKHKLAAVFEPIPSEEFIQRCSQSTLRAVKRLARVGGPSLIDLRGYQQPNSTYLKMSSQPSSLGRRKRGSQSPVKHDSATTTTSRTTGQYDRAFLQHLIDHETLPDGYEYPDGQLPPEPDNIDEIRAALAQPRPSLSPSRLSKEDFRRFKGADTHASKEAQVMSKVIPIIEGDIRDPKATASDILFSNLEPLTDGTLKPPKPDIYYGARPEQLDRDIRNTLGPYIVPSPQHDLPILPNFSLEAKGPDGSISVATRQATYVGAICARGMAELRSFGDKGGPKHDNNAYTLTSIYHGGQLKIYANHPIKPTVSGRSSGYTTTQITAYAMTNDLDTFRKGALAFRNSRDWAERQRNEAITKANKRARNEVDALGLSSKDGCLALEPGRQETTADNEPDERCESDTSSDSRDTLRENKHGLP